MFVDSSKLPLKDMARFGMTLLCKGRIIGIIVDEDDYSCYIVGKKGEFNTNKEAISNLPNHCFMYCECDYRNGIK